MARRERSEVLRSMSAADVASVVGVQEPGAVRGLDRVFPRESYPFPREEIVRRWLKEIDSPTIDCFVVLVEEAIQGFAALRHDEFLHFGIAVPHRPKRSAQPLMIARGRARVADDRLLPWASM